MTRIFEAIGFAVTAVSSTWFIYWLIVTKLLKIERKDNNEALYCYGYAVFMVFFTLMVRAVTGYFYNY